MIDVRFDAVGSTRYRTGTSGIGWREDDICLTPSVFIAPWSVPKHTYALLPPMSVDH